MFAKMAVVFPMEKKEISYASSGVIWIALRAVPPNANHPAATEIPFLMSPTSDRESVPFGWDSSRAAKPSVKSVQTSTSVGARHPPSMKAAFDWRSFQLIWWNSVQ